MDVDYLDIKLVVDGKEVTPKDVNGKVVEPFAYNGTTYLPVRAVGEALGKTVRWDGETKTVHLGEMPQGTYLVDVCKAVGSVYRAADHKAFVASGGKRYSQGFVDDVTFELGGKYESLTFELLATGPGTVNVYLDGKLAQEINVKAGDDVQTVTMPLDYAQIIAFDFNYYSDYRVAVANAVLSGEREAPAKPVPPANAAFLYDGSKDTTKSDAFGNVYTRCVHPGILALSDSPIALNGKYKTLKATVISTSINTVSWPLRFNVDGQDYTFNYPAYAPPQTIEVPLNYGMELSIGSYTSGLYLVDAYLE